jgi:hypothetical protein
LDDLVIRDQAVGGRFGHVRPTRLPLWLDTLN